MKLNKGSGFGPVCSYKETMESGTICSGIAEYIP